MHRKQLYRPVAECRIESAFRFMHALLLAGLMLCTCRPGSVGARERGRVERHCNGPQARDGSLERAATLAEWIEEGGEAAA